MKEAGPKEVTRQLVVEGFRRAGSCIALKARPSQIPGTPQSHEHGRTLCRTLTVWCKHRVSEAPAFLPQSGHTRCTEMAAALLSMPPRSTGTVDSPPGGEEKGRQPKPEMAPSQGPESHIQF